MYQVGKNREKERTYHNSGGRKKERRMKQDVQRKEYVLKITQLRDTKCLQDSHYTENIWSKTTEETSRKWKKAIKLNKVKCKQTQTIITLIMIII